MTMLPDFRLETYLSKWEFAARYHMTASDMETFSLGELLELAEPADRDAWQRLPLGYIETYGTPLLRETIAGTYDTLQPADILCFAGAEEGIFAAMHALLEKDDHAIILRSEEHTSELQSL